MSIGAVPQQFEGPAQDPAFDPSVSPTAITEVPAYAPGPAAVAALGLPPAPPPAAPLPGGALSPEQLAAAATGQPPAPVPPPVVPAPATPEEAAAANVARAGAIGDESVANATEKADLGTQLATNIEGFKAEHAKAQKEILDRQELHRQAAENAVADARAKAENEPFHTYAETRTIGQDIITGIGLILGGFSWNPAHVNRGIQLLDKATDENLEKQKSRHADLWKAVESAERGERDLDARQLRDLSAFNAEQGAKLDAVAGRLAAGIAANRGKGDVTEAKKKALELSEKATEAWKTSTSAAAAANHMEEEEKIARERIAEQERAAALRAKGRRGSGGGSGASGGALSQAAVALADEIQAAKAAGKPMTQADVDRRAVALKIPLVGKPSTINARQIFADAGKQFAGEGKEHTITEKDEKEVVRDEKGMAIGRVTSGKGGAQGFVTRDVQFGDAARRVRELAEDIKTNGTKINPTDTKAVIDRATKYANAIIALGVVSPLGKTNESLKLEAESLGFSSGAIDPNHLIASLSKEIAYGANLDAVERKFTDINGVRNQYRKQTLIPLGAEEKARFNANVASEGRWVPVPARLSSQPKYAGKKEVQISPDGTVTGTR